MIEPLLHTASLNKHFGALHVCRDLTLNIAPGELHALIGPNGAGKSTILNLLGGLLKADSGNLFFKGRDIIKFPVHKRARIGIAKSFQVTSVFDAFTVMENFSLAVQAASSKHWNFWSDTAHDDALNVPAAAFMERMGLSDRAQERAANLSHGERRQLEMGMALATGAELLLLDEPMAGMGPGGTKKLAELIKGLKGEVTMLLVEHDMRAVFALADRITVLVQGAVAATGTPDEIRNNELVQEAYLGA